MSASTWLELTLNGPWSRARQPRVAVLADEIVDDRLRCVHAAASIMQFKVCDAASSRQRLDGAMYAPIIGRIRSRAGASCCTTLAFLPWLVIGPAKWSAK